MAGTYEIPAEGSPNSTQDPKIKTFMESWNSKLNAENDLEDSGIASPNNSAYRTLLSGQQMIAADAAAATYIIARSGGATAPASGGEPVNPSFFYFDDADYTVPGKTQKLRLRVQVAANATKPALKFTFGLYPMTVAGGADAITTTLGTVVSGSATEVNEPAASTVTSAVSSDFTIPSDGAYILGVVTSATLTNNSKVIVSAQLQTRSV